MHQVLVACDELSNGPRLVLDDSLWHIDVGPIAAALPVYACTARQSQVPDWHEWMH